MAEFDWTELEILILDDNIQFCQLVADVLRGKGVRRIHTIGDGASALNLLRSTPVDIALVDFIMTPLDGGEFTHMVRHSSDSPNKELPIVIMTGDSTERTLRAVVDAGAHDFLVKPITPAELFWRIERTLSEPRPFIKKGAFYGPAPLDSHQEKEGPRQRGVLGVLFDE